MPTGDIRRLQSIVIRYQAIVRFSSRKPTEIIQVINRKTIFLHDLLKLLADFRCPIPPVVTAVFVGVYFTVCASLEHATNNCLWVSIYSASQPLMGRTYTCWRFPYSEGIRGWIKDEFYRS